MIGVWIAGAAQTAADRQAVFARHHQVQYQQVVPFALPQPVHRLRIVSHEHRVSVLSQIAPQQVAQPHVIVDDQNFRGLVRVHLAGGGSFGCASSFR